jgi:Mg2+/Co2+ transporter CorB
MGSAFQILLPWLVTMAVLLICSAFFSASEAALFFLQPRDRRMMAGGNPAQRMAVSLLDRPERLLSAVLFWNLVINIAYFSISSICALRIEQNPALGQSVAFGFAMASLLAIIFFSEMLPKSFAVLKPSLLAQTVSFPLSLAVRLVDPIMPLLQSVNLVSTRLIWPGFEPEAEIDVSDLERAIEHSSSDPNLIRQEQAVLQNVVQLSNILIEEWMRPRTQFMNFHPPVSLADLNGTVPASGYLLVTEDDTDNIEKAIRLDNQYELPEQNLEKLAKSVLYLPWCATVADALEKMTHREREVTVVVNEYGDTIGILTIEDILETVFVYSPSRAYRLLDLPPIEQIDEHRWCVSGIMSLRQLSRRFDLELPETDSVTVGGVIQEQLQRLARKGDQCDWGPFSFKVIEIPQRGTLLVELTRNERRSAERRP